MYHTNKHILGELTFGEYWNLAGCNAGAAKIKGISKHCYNFETEPDRIKFLYEDRYDGDGSLYSVRIPLKAKVKVAGNQVRTKDQNGFDVTIEFYDLVPTKSPV